MTMPISERYYRKLNVPAGDLRISITEACNMKCVYCHNEGQLSKQKMMDKDEVLSIVSQAKKYGVYKVRLTGGEPLVHPEIYDICVELKRKTNIQNLGLNTNGMNRQQLLRLCSENLLDQVVVGLDYFNRAVSKNSPVGASSQEIRETILDLKRMGVNVQVATVYSDNLEDIYNLVEWCLDNHILMKVLEVSTPFSEQNQFDPNPFNQLIEDILIKYNLRKGITVDLNELYGYNDTGKVLFFQSHCNRKQCDTCARLHMRVTANGNAKPCIQRTDTEFFLLNRFDDSMCKAIVNLGNPPDCNPF